MPPRTPIDTLEAFSARYAQSVARCHARSGASRWHLPQAELAEAIRAGVAASIAEASDAEVERYVDSLRAEDLALACACSLGIESAWEQFIADFRPVLYGAARALTRDAVAARELADSLYAEVYGLEMRDGQRRSLLRYFHGRSSLGTWLRAIVAQRYVDGWRGARRTESLEDSPADVAGAVSSEPPDPDRALYLNSLNQSLGAALGALKPRDRLRLSCYYLEEMTLKEIGRLTNEHESTVSRRLARTRKALKRQVERTLRREKHLSDEQIGLCYDYAIEDWPFDLGKILERPR